jgi:hypothetical protein
MNLSRYYKVQQILQPGVWLLVRLVRTTCSHVKNFRHDDSGKLSLYLKKFQVASICISGNHVMNCSQSFIYINYHYIAVSHYT